MSKPIIGIAANQLAAGSTEFHGNPVSYTPQGFVSAAEKVGGLPLLLPITHPDHAQAYISSVDKLLLAGGQDVDPFLYGEAPHPLLQGTSPDRDIFEQALIKEALAQHKPIFAVCRGMQLLNVTLGGSLYQDLSLYSDWSVRHLQDPTLPKDPSHSISVIKDSLLESLIGDSYRVNSYHHQAIKRLADSLKVSALSPDQLVEAVEWHDDSQRVLAVQWHPELSFHVHSPDLTLFDYFVNQL